MSLLEAVVEAGAYPSAGDRSEKKRYAERLSHALADRIAAGLRERGFFNIKPDASGGREKAFYGGFGSKKVDVSYADDQHGLMLAATIKSIAVAPFGKNLKNRFGDLCAEAITLHMRFPFAVVAAIFAFPEEANLDTTTKRKRSTFQRALELMDTVNGRLSYSDAYEKFECVTMLLFRPQNANDAILKLFDVASKRELTEDEFFSNIVRIYNVRNPLSPVGEPDLDEEA